MTFSPEETPIAPVAQGVEPESVPRAGPTEGSETGPGGTEAASSDAPAPKAPKKKAPKKAPAESAPALAAPKGGPPEISVIVAVTTGDGRVREVVTALSAELERLGRSHEFVLVFDGVRGHAWTEAEALAQERPGVVVSIALQQQFGESMCLSAGLQRARGRIVVTSPQYVQVDPYELSNMLAAIDGGADLVAPWRHPRIDPVLNRIQSAAFNQVMRWILHAQFHDLNCTFRVMRREVLRDVPIHGDMYRFLPAIASRQGFKVVELQVRHLKEWGGKGFFGPGVYVRRALDVLGVVFLSKFTLKPLRFFGTVGGVFLLLGAVLCSTMVVQGLVLGDGLNFSRPLFLVGVLSSVLGVQVIGFGLVGEIIIYTRARNVREYRVEKVWEGRDEPGDGDGSSTPGR
ncbi:MAG: glycosyltransferase [Planctomycetota bacterium]|nr:glycosyltransferase [Planctomycetota bacterium]